MPTERKRGQHLRPMSATLTDDARDYLLRGHDFFNSGFADNPERMRALWEAHRDELLALWRAPRGTCETDPLFWCDHGPHLRCWAEKHFDPQPVRFRPAIETR